VASQMAQQPHPPSSKGPIVLVAVIAIILVGAISAIVYYTVKTSSCSGYPPGGDCVAPYSYTFTIVVNYTGRWSLNFTGQTNVGEANPTNVTGTHIGTGYFTVPATLSGLNTRMLTICAHAQKLDPSTSTLLLSIDSLYPKNTSTPYGPVSTCGGVAP
jgi:hypothetical protein